MRKIISIIILALVFLMGITGSTFAEEDALFVEETGFWIQGRFLEFFNSFEDPFFLFGNPISNQIYDTTQGFSIQYFENVRMELVNQQVKLTALGSSFYSPALSAELDQPQSACRLFSESGYRVCYAFLKFYFLHGGESTFGLPISNLEIQSGRFVQSFENARFVWLPENPAGQRVALSNLGEQHMKMYGPTLIEQDPALENVLSRITINAFVDHSFLSAGEEQTVNVLVQDQWKQPVEGAYIVISVTYPSGEIETYTPALSNNSGISKADFPVKSTGTRETLVTIQVEVHNDNEVESTSTWFRIQ